MNRILPLSEWLSASRPDETPVAWQDDHVWTLGQLRNDVSQLVKTLQQYEGDRWALCFENSYLFIIALLGSLTAGKTPVIPGHSRVSVLEDQRALFDGVLSDRMLGWTGNQIVVTSAKKNVQAGTSLPAIADDCFVELFTSGSTGQPKRIVKPIECLDREISVLAAHFGGQLAGCRVVASVVPQHLYGLTFRIFLPMSLGLPLHASMLYYAEQLAALDHQHRYVFVSSPAFLKRIDLNLMPPPIAKLLSAGGLLPWKDVEQSHAWLNLWPDEIYGSTETGILAQRSRQADDIGWQTFPGVQIHQNGDLFRATSPLIPCEQGVELDDILHFDDAGLFHLSGRRGRVVKIEEKRVSLTEVERRLMTLAGIRDAVALPVSHGGRQGIGALLVLEDDLHHEWQQCGGKSLEFSWRRSLLPWLEPVAIPRYWRIIDEIPVNSMNKRVYAQLQELFHETTP